MSSKHDTEYIYRRAHELALSGCCPNEVVATLLREGYPQAAAMFDSDVIRADLRQLAQSSESSDILAFLWPRASLNDNRDALKQGVSGTALGAPYGSNPDSESSH